MALPATAQAVTIDIGNPADIHPVNKQDVGHRLALAARSVAYGESLTYSGPVYDAVRIEGSKLRVSFKPSEGGLAARGGKELQGFVAGRCGSKLPCRARGNRRQQHPRQQ